MIRRPVVVLALLTALNLLNYLDRYVLSAVLAPIERDLSLSHGVAGLLGTIFLIGYFVTSPVFGTLADRGKRTGLLALGILVWSVATIACGFATGAVSLALARVAVGVGEASYATIAPTMIDDLAPRESKSTWLAIFYSASPIGSALGYVTGGVVEKSHGWRTAFFVAGGPGLLLAIACMFLVDPKRAEVAKPGRMLDTVRPLLGIPLYVRAVLGYAAYTFAVGGFGYWGPTYLFHRFDSAGLTLRDANLGMGAVTVLGGAIGTAIGGFWGDRTVRVGNDGAGGAAGTGGTKNDEATAASRKVKRLLRLCSIGSLIAAPLAALAVLAPTPTLFFAAFFCCEVAIFIATSPINAAILTAVPIQVRASAMALCIFGIHALGDLWSPPGVGALADLSSMRVAMLLLPVAILVSAIVWRPRAPDAHPQTA